MQRRSERHDRTSRRNDSQIRRHPSGMIIGKDGQARSMRKPVFSDPSSHRFRHMTKFGIGATFAVSVRLEFECDVIRPALRTFDKTVIKRRHGSWGIYTKNSLTGESAENAKVRDGCGSRIGTVWARNQRISVAVPCVCSAHLYARLKEIRWETIPPSEGFHSLINTLIGKVFGTKNERVVKSLMPRVETINALEPQIQKLSDDELRAKTDEFRQRIQQRMSRIEGTQASMVDDVSISDPDRAKQLQKEQYDALQDALDEILVEAFAVVREAGRRVLNMRHFDVQLIGGMVQ